MSDQEKDHGPDECLACWLRSKGVDGDLAGILMAAGFLTGWEKGIVEAKSRAKHLFLRVLMSQPDITVEDMQVVEGRVREWSAMAKDHGGVPVSPEVAKFIRERGGR